MAVTAPAVTGTPQAFSFTTSGTVVTYTGGGTANATTYDVLLVNSDNIVTTPAGWSVAVSAVTNQGSYIFYKSGGTTSATIALGGGVASNTGVLWVRITNATTVDQVIAAQANASAGSTTPTATTAALAASTDLSLALAALHSFNTGTPTGGTWSTGYTELITTSSLSGANTTYTYSSAGVKVPAGTAAESPSYSWTNPTFERYALVVTFTGFDAGTGGATPDGIAVTTALGSHTVSLNRSAAPSGIAVSAALGSHTVALNRSAAPTGIAATVAFGTPSVSSAPGPSGIAITTALGTHTASLNLTAAPSGIAASTAPGVPTVSLLSGSPTGVSATVALGVPTVALGRTALPTGLALVTALGNPSIVTTASPTGITVTSGVGNPSVGSTVLTAGAPGSWYGLKVTDDLNLRYLREDRREPVACPNDGTPLQHNPRTGKLQCSYDGFVYLGW